MLVVFSAAENPPAFTSTGDPDNKVAFTELLILKPNEFSPHVLLKSTSHSPCVPRILKAADLSFTSHPLRLGTAHALAQGHLVLCLEAMDGK